LNGEIAGAVLTVTIRREKNKARIASSTLCRRASYRIAQRRQSFIDWD